MNLEKDVFVAAVYEVGIWLLFSCGVSSKA